LIVVDLSQLFLRYSVNHTLEYQFVKNDCFVSETNEKKLGFFTGWMIQLGALGSSNCLKWPGHHQL